MKPALVSKIAMVTLVAALSATVAALLMGPAARGASASQTPAYLQIPARVNMVIVPGGRLGSDNKMHDAFTPTDFTAVAGQTIIVTVYNYDTMPHSITTPGMMAAGMMYGAATSGMMGTMSRQSAAGAHLNVTIPAAPKDGVPAIKTFSFRVTTPGSYHWLCILPCDDDANGWAMSHDHFMAGTITITRA
jgi:membrane fusion protein, multidrug efflux system